MSELEDEIGNLKIEIESDEIKITGLKSGLWQKKKSLKSLEEALAIINGTKANEDSDNETTELKTII